MIKFFITTIFLIFSFNIFAEKKTCTKLETCVNLAAKLTKKNYLYGKKLKGNINASANFKFTKKNADKLISLILNENGYTRIPLEDNKGFRVVNARDVRYTPTRLYSKKDIDQMPLNFDYVMFSIKLKSIDSTQVTRSFRPFMSRYGRIIDIKQTNTIIIQDTAQNIRRMIKLVKLIDLPRTSEQIELMKEDKENKFQIKLLKAKNCVDDSNEINQLKRSIEDLETSQKNLLIHLSKKI